jgi:ribosomal protein L37AE/L43A
MDFVLVQTFNDYIDANIILARLQNEGINCWLKDENLVITIPLWATAAGGIKLMIADTHVEEAKKLLNDFADEKRKQFSCPKCGSNEIEFISSPRDGRNWLSVILGFFFFDYAMPVKTWHCFKCGTEFKEPVEQETKATGDENAP